MAPENKEYVGRCPFCNLGNQDERGVIKTEESITRENDSTGEEYQSSIEIYKCAIGQECIIPYLYELGSCPSPPPIDLMRF